MTESLTFPPPVRCLLGNEWERSQGGEEGREKVIIPIFTLMWLYDLALHRAGIVFLVSLHGSTIQVPGMRE